MNRGILALLLVPALLATSARLGGAEGLNLSWTDCQSASRSSSDVSFSCDNESGTFVLVASFIPPTSLDQLAAEDGYISFVSDKPALADWWRLGDGGCRGTAASYGTAVPGLGSCQNPWSTMSAGGQNWTYPSAGHAQLEFVWARAPQAISPMSAGREYIAFVITLGTEGSSACAGCQEPICIVFDNMMLEQTGEASDYLLSRAAGRNYATWQGGGSACRAAGARETQRKSWGQIKGIYR